MGKAAISDFEHRAIVDAYWEQIEFGSRPESAMNLAVIVYQQRHPAIPVDEARAFVGGVLDKSQQIG